MPAATRTPVPVLHGHPWQTSCGFCGPIAWTACLLFDQVPQDQRLFLSLSASLGPGTRRLNMELRKG